MERSVIIFTVPELISIMFLILLSVAGIIYCLCSRNKTSVKAALDGAMDSYIIHCRNEAIRKYREDMNERAAFRRSNPSARIDYWEYTPELAGGQFLSFAEELSRIKGPHQIMMYYYRELPKVMYAVVAAVPDSNYHGGNIAFTAAMKRFYLNPQTRKAVEDAIKNKTELPIY